MSVSVTRPPVAPGLRAILVAIAVLVVGLSCYVVRHAPPRPLVHRAQGQVRVIPPSEVPEVEPVEYQALDPDDARAVNATVPFSTDPNPAARPFRFAGTDADRARATDCLAVAVLYEAGDDTVGERAVAQVILNRARHPAFPKTICGVVFQGSERRTGCQFTFSCDGALSRWKPSEAAWARAREVATLALDGAVYKPVGYATHYHTDWVVPYWSSSLDKVAAVHSHLFFRWTGWWGTPGAFARGIASGEPSVALLAALSPAHRDGAALIDGVAIAGADSDVIDAAVTAITEDSALKLLDDPDSFLVTLDPKLGADSFPMIAAKTCGVRAYCKLMAWTDRARTPATLPLDMRQMATMAFSYLRDRAHGYEKALWNCAQFNRTNKGQCMKTQMLTAGAEPGEAPAANGVAAAPPVQPAIRFTGRPATGPIVPAMAMDGLAGVRRKPADVPRPAGPTRRSALLPRHRYRPSLPRPEPGFAPGSGPPVDQAVANASGASVITASAPPSISRRSDPARGMIRSAKNRAVTSLASRNAASPSPAAFSLTAATDRRSHIRPTATMPMMCM